MSMPTIPDINIDREDAINIIIASIAMEELALAHILNAEGEKLQYVLGTLKNTSQPEEITICDIMAVNESIQKTLRDVIKEEMLLQLKLEDAVGLAEEEDKCRITIKGHKIWRDGNNLAKTRPSLVKITLLRDGKAYRSIDIDSAGDGIYTFECLPVYKSPGIKYIYSVDEIDVPDKYKKTVDGYNIINTVAPGSITITGTKIWDDDDNDSGLRPPKITVNLLQNGSKYRPLEVTSPVAPINTVRFDFENVPQFDNEGDPYAYSVDEEEPVTGYEKSIEGNNITNTLL